jgi:hypothetical protein
VIPCLKTNSLTYSSIEQIEEVRQNVLSKAIQVVGKAIKKYHGPRVHCTSKFGLKETAKNSACDALILGSLLRGALAIGIWPPPSAPFPVMSCNTTIAEIRNLNITAVCDSSITTSTWTPAPPAPSHGVKASITKDMDALGILMGGLELKDFK